MKWEMYEDEYTGLRRVRAVKEYPGEVPWRDERKPFTGYRTANWVWMEDFIIALLVNCFTAFFIPVMLFEKHLAGMVGYYALGRRFYYWLNTLKEKG